MSSRMDLFGLGTFVRKREVLELIAERTRNGRETSYRTLVNELGLSPDAAASHLKRLWTQGFIKNTTDTGRASERLGPGESIRDLRFILARRGRERLTWYRQGDEEE